MHTFYEVYKSPRPKESKENAKSYVRVISKRLVSEKTFNEEISRASSLTPGDVLGALSALCDTLIDHLSEGEKVKLPGIGTFSLIAECPDDFNNEGTYYPSRQIKVRSINFRPDRDLVTKINGKTDFQHYRYSLHSASHTKEEELQILKKALVGGRSRTLKELAGELEYNPVKANYRIKQLVDEGYLLCTGTKNIYYYEATDKLLK